jgi:hypothetical protein
VISRVGTIAAPYREKLLETTIIKEARSVVRRLHAIRLALRSSDLICKLRIDLEGGMWGERDVKKSNCDH